jgi:hypothetical protein
MEARAGLCDSIHPGEPLVDVTPAMCAGQGIKHLSNESVEALQNLLHLIRADAGNAQRVHDYLDIAEKVLSDLRTSIAAASLC